MPQGRGVVAAVRPRGGEEEEPRAAWENRRRVPPEVPGGVACGCREEQNEVEPPGGRGGVSPADPTPVGGAAGSGLGSAFTRQRSSAEFETLRSLLLAKTVNAPELKKTRIPQKRHSEISSMIT